VLLLRGIGLDIAGVQEAVENIQGVLGVDPGLYENLGADGAGGKINGPEDGSLPAAEFQILIVCERCSFRAEIWRKSLD
jgi:hypothetical protein